MLGIIIIILIFGFTANMIVFPFKTAYVNRNGDITQDSKEYNSTHFGFDNFDMPLYTEIKIGEPPQNLKIILTSEACGSFKIGKSKLCVYSDEYLSYYNRNNSEDFNYTSQYKGSDPDFDFNKNASTAEDLLYTYSDMKLKNETHLKNIGFYLGTDTNDKLCGTIGFKKDDLLCERIINITTYLKRKRYINNYKFMIKYNSTNEGYYIIGGKLKDIIEDYNENNTFSKKVNVGIAKRDWEINIEKIKVNNYDEPVQNETVGVFQNDFSLIMGSDNYKYYIKNNSTFKEYFDKEICSFKLFDKDPSLKTYYKYEIIECDKERMGINDIKKFPELIIYTRELGALNKFSFDYKDLFTETKYKYFVNVIFDKFRNNKWIFGKTFLRKYPINFDFESQSIEVYDNYHKEEPEPEHGGNPDNPNNPKGKDNTALYIVIIAGLVAIAGVVGYFLGKYINKIRKKRANELLDDYDYNPITRQTTDSTEQKQETNS